MSTSANKGWRSAGCLLTYVCVSLSCLVFFLVYDRFSYGVRSAYMSFLFAWPLTLGVLPCLALKLLPRLRRDGVWAKNLYHSGVAALTVSSALRGILEIAGTASEHQEFLTLAGAVLTLCGVIAYIANK